MPARKQGRARFDFHGRSFLWWYDDTKYIRICSTDKRFSVALVIGTEWEDWPVIQVIGPEFPGIASTEPRPLWLRMPELDWSTTGKLVDDVLRWSFDTDQERVPFEGPPRWCAAPDSDED